MEEQSTDSVIRSFNHTSSANAVSNNSIAPLETNIFDLASLEPVLINPENKAKFLSKIQKMIASTLENMKMLNLIRTNSNFNQIQRVLQKLHNFIIFCSEKYVYIFNTNTLPSSEFHFPHEKALISDNIDDYLAQFSHPMITFSDSNEIIYSPSTFLHAWTHHSHFSCVYSSFHKLQCIPGNKVIKNPQIFTENSRILALDNERIMITGGKTKNNIFKADCIILNIIKEQYYFIAKLNQARKCHNMCFIGRNPSVIGGDYQASAIKSTEIYENGC